MEDDVVVVAIVVLDNVVVLVVVLDDNIVVLELRFRFKLFSELPSFSPSDLF